MSSLPPGPEPQGAKAPRVLIAGAGEEILPSLRGSVLLRSGIAFSRDLHTAFDIARGYSPAMVIVHGADEAEAAVLARRLREDERTRRCSIVVLARSANTGGALSGAGVNAVIPKRDTLAQWNTRLEQLLSVAKRRDTNLPVHFHCWSARGADADRLQGTALNLSIHGVLLESTVPLEIGERVDLALALPGPVGEARAFGSVVRIATSKALPRRGIEFLVLSGDSRSRIEQFVGA
jgi:hypothetical protein